MQKIAQNSPPFPFWQEFPVGSELGLNVNYQTLVSRSNQSSKSIPTGHSEYEQLTDSRPARKGICKLGQITHCHCHMLMSKRDPSALSEFTSAGNYRWTCTWHRSKRNTRNLLSSLEKDILFPAFSDHVSLLKTEMPRECN